MHKVVYCDSRSYEISVGEYSSDSANLEDDVSIREAGQLQ